MDGGELEPTSIAFSGSFFEQIESLRSEQIRVGQQLLEERAANRQIRTALASVERECHICSIKREEISQKLSDMKLKYSHLQQDTGIIKHGTGI